MFSYKQMYIDGKLQDASNKVRKEVLCPATDEVIGVVAWATVTDTQKALNSAQRAFKPWSTMPIKDRVGYMYKLQKLVIENQEELRIAEMYEHGKTYEQTEEGYLRIIESLDFYAQEILRLHGLLLVDSDGDFEHKITHHAAGVAGAFLAWNFPLLNIGYKLGPAMAAGCPLILRPSTETPITAYMIGELCYRAGLPPGAVNIVAGPVSETANIITKSSIPAVLTVIGSTQTGLDIIKNGASSVKKYSMELGGNAPAIVFKDADIDLAASLISILKFSNTGQICVTPNRIFVHESIHHEFLQKVVAKATEVKIGHGKDSGATMGPLINSRARERIDSWVQKAVKDGSKLCYGGKIPENLAAKGCYYMPTVLDNVPDDSIVSCDEVFGPVVSITSFRDYDEVMRRANSTDMGLASYIFSNDITTIQKASAELDFGEVHVNGVKYAIDLPHLGIKQSGVGMDCSSFALEDYMVKKRVTIAKL